MGAFGILATAWTNSASRALRSASVTTKPSFFALLTRTDSRTKLWTSWFWMAWLTTSISFEGMFFCARRMAATSFSIAARVRGMPLTERTTVESVETASSASFLQPATRAHASAAHIKVFVFISLPV